MRMPSKFVKYKNSTLYKMPKFLKLLEDNDLSVRDLYKKTKQLVDGMNDFIEVLDCLYILGKIELKEEIVHYVKNN